MKAIYPNAEVLDIDFESLDQWLSWKDANPHPISDERNRQIAAHTTQHGVWEPVTRRYFGPGDISWNLDNLRESGIAGGINSRNRAVLYALHACLGDFQPHRTKIYGTEAVTDMALRLRGCFPKFIGSEYTSDPAVSDDLYPIPTEDLTKLSFRSDIFDAVVTTEVLEHVPSLDAALGEIARVLRPGGWHVGTCPFAFMQNESILRTIIKDGELVHLMEPEWHGDPMGTGGSLVFEIPGWHMLQRAKAAGFSRAFWKYVQSQTFGIGANHAGGVFVLCMQR